MQKILIIEEEEISETMLEICFMDIFEILKAENKAQALDIIKTTPELRALILDLNILSQDGFELLNYLKGTGFVKDTPVFVLTSSSDSNILMDIYDMGIADVINFPFNVNFVRQRILNTIELYALRKDFNGKIEQNTLKQREQNNLLIQTVVSMIESRSVSKDSGLSKVSKITKILMQDLVNKYEQYSYLKNDVDTIALASSLHDLGKATVSLPVLNKKDSLTTQEMKDIKDHTIKGYQQFTQVKDSLDPKLYEYASDICRHHHERYDGKGYPDGLSGDKIRIYSQVAGLADAYDALTSDRAYRKAYDSETAFNMIKDGECGSFNPIVITLMEHNKKEIEALLSETEKTPDKKQILLIDNSTIDYSVLKRILQNNYDITNVHEAHKGLDILMEENRHFDLILVNTKLSDMGFFDFITSLGKDFVQENTIALIVSEATKQSLIMASSCGITKYIEKPFDEDIVQREVYELTK